MEVKYDIKRWIILIIFAAIPGIFGGAIGIGGIIAAIILNIFFYFQDKRKKIIISISRFHFSLVKIP